MCQKLVLLVAQDMMLKPTTVDSNHTCQLRLILLLKENQMRFRFEQTKPSTLEDNIFADIEFPTNQRIVHEFEMSDATQWDNIIIQFAKFLDATGYVGVYERVSTYVDHNWNNFGDIDEDTSNTGLSD